MLGQQGHPPSAPCAAGDKYGDEEMQAEDAGRETEEHLTYMIQVQVQVLAQLDPY